MEEHVGKTIEDNGKWMKTAGKTMKKKGGQEPPPKNNLNSAPIWMRDDLDFRGFKRGCIFNLAEHPCKIQICTLQRNKPFKGFRSQVSRKSEWRPLRSRLVLNPNCFSIVVLVHHGCQSLCNICAIFVRFSRQQGVADVDPQTNPSSAFPSLFRVTWSQHIVEHVQQIIVHVFVPGDEIRCI